jgi:arabinoxylan arabinofuranohydrolase
MTRLYAFTACSLLALSGIAARAGTGGPVDEPAAPGSNPLFSEMFTADPAPMVHDGRVYLYTGHDEAGPDQMFNITEWLVFSSDDMRNWTAHGPVMKPTDFAWATRDDTDPGKAIGVAVSDSPTGPFVDARGSALISNSMTKMAAHSWDDIDPTVFQDDDGTAWLWWGNQILYYVKLAPNMIELDGPIRTLDIAPYEEGPWIHKHDGTYYLLYAAIDRSVSDDEQIHYATAPSITGPWTLQGMLTGSGENSFTIHPGTVEFEGQWYLFYHDASQTIDGVPGAIGRRSVRVEYLYHNEDGTLEPVEQTPAGISVPPRTAPANQSSEKGQTP